MISLNRRTGFQLYKKYKKKSLDSSDDEGTGWIILYTWFIWHGHWDTCWVLDIGLDPNSYMISSPMSLSLFLTDHCYIFMKNQDWQGSRFWIDVTLVTQNVTGWMKRCAARSYRVRQPYDALLILKEDLLIPKNNIISLALLLSTLE